MKEFFRSYSLLPEHSMYDACGVTVEKRKKAISKIGILLAVAATFILAQYYLDVARYLEPALVKGWLVRTGALAPLTYMAVMALVVATPLPSLPLNFAAGAFFGPLWGTLYSVSGATGGALISFFLARFLGRKFIERFLKGHIHFCTSCSDRLLTMFVFLARLVPVFSFDVISYGAGLTKMSVWNFIIANFLGMLPLTFLYNYAGTAVAVGNILSFALAAIMVALFFLVPEWIDRSNPPFLRRFFDHPPDEAVPGDTKKVP